MQPCHQTELRGRAKHTCNSSGLFFSSKVSEEKVIVIIVLFILWPPQDPGDSGVELDLKMENKLSQKQPVLKIEVTLKSCLICH